MIESQVEAGSERVRPDVSEGQRPDLAGLARADAPASAPDPAHAYPLDALQSLTETIEVACEDLFAAAPFVGEQATGASIDAFVDHVVAALRSVQSEADDLRRAMSIAQRRMGARDEGGARS